MNPRKNLIIVSLSHYLIEQIKSGIHLWYPIGLDWSTEYHNIIMVEIESLFVLIFYTKFHKSK